MPMDDASIEQVLARNGEAVYRWTIGDDSLAWSAGAARLLGVADPAAIATGAAYHALSDTGNPVSRREQVLKGLGFDNGEGVSYRIEYALRPEGLDGPVVWIEDIGRWYAEGSRRAVRAEGLVRVINERHAREQRLAFLTRYDTETGLLNRAYLLDLLTNTIADARKFRTSAAFLQIAIDDLPLINAAYGLQAGDRAVVAVAQRIRGRLREGDAIARYSGGKLALLLMNCDEQEMQVAAERFLAAVREDVIVTPEAAFAITVSIGGVAIPRHGRNRAECLERAQESLDLARGAGRGRFVAFAPSAERAEQRRANAALSRQLVGALTERRLRLAFQPVVDIATRRPLFHEALLRLVQPDGSIVSAGHVMPLAEQLGLARLFDLAILELVLKALADHQEAVLSVNVAPETIAAPDWLALVTEMVERRPDIGRRLIVEITETSAIRNIKETELFVDAVHRLGARVAIDDFGAGYTSFRSLRRLAVDVVKIDGDFVRAITASGDDQIFVRRLAELARDLGIETVAEWVQDEAAVRLLAGWGVQAIQGDVSGEASLDPPWAATNSD
ncbi:bifunctional diguanylate cyclase/phosphodiesterase [Kaistia geumhonensis]|uniref:Diguanylate cyclase (GGDEF)-like protein n=1 Tax=Kaistia geumhonensis TaxID=410839 RepID=A0ABU0M8Z9_9HYPH|nr:bifunctional diguanylate cyclase/phosphodiesterase [Kaistia geumhonensis]MCX5477395.1 bifunctional diguanylate cyclase/phosphodiesterase [Kaistia geumhonensis]MDQ0517398.1 diguanylate cyclase (GGDEF)-like protein [Kaistia geumhonensis]